MLGTSQTAQCLFHMTNE